MVLSTESGTKRFPNIFHPYRKSVVSSLVESGVNPGILMLKLYFLEFVGKIELSSKAIISLKLRKKCRNMSLMCMKNVTGLLKLE
jgi:hypothetical protein